ncbi:FHA domain-containing protein [Comamonas sp. J-3]|uniref:FHA domain-containing protein n=1 Tax=Comamonas trifloxystrobinivorans TaxID=3350256 RepID=UPI00372AC497
MLPEIVVNPGSKSDTCSIVLEKGSTLIGRGKECEVFLDDPSISRDHGAFVYLLGVLMIEDHCSTNGTFVNDIRVKRQVLYSGDIVKVGQLEIAIKIGSGFGDDLLRATGPSAA